MTTPPLEDSRPIIYDPRQPSDASALSDVFALPSIRIIDDWEAQAREYEQILNPASLQNPSVRPEQSLPKESGVWVYYPWRHCVIHCLPSPEYAHLRASRNQNLITPAEQEQFRNARIGIAGLNVGNPAALCIALESGGVSMKFADNDHLAASNLNRFRAGLCDIGLNKAILTARQVYEIDPFASIEVFDHGITPENIEQFLLEPRLDVLVEETDNLELKIRIRELARQHRIPVVMVTGNGENIIIDIERFDQNQNLPLLNGYLQQSVIDEIRAGVPSFSKKVQLARDFMGAQHLTSRLRESFDHIGVSLAGIPQIAESSFLRGAAVSYAVRQIVTGGHAPSGRFFLKMDTMLTP